ncbi:hypothetical protein VKT23_016316 [Stygiomarasmius scandens]|uniref:Uncharacterized protein n=1 Tax=Marasmiellus scandens TaxID=2682957 RepID=A0ABR1IZP9_9AGAR
MHPVSRKESGFGEFKEFKRYSDRKYSSPGVADHTFHVELRNFVIYTDVDSLPILTGCFFVPKSAYNLLFDALVFDKEDHCMVVWVFQFTIDTTRSKGSNQGYAHLERIQQRVLEMGGISEVVFRYVLVVPDERAQLNTMSWQFPDWKPKPKPTDIAASSAQVTEILSDQATNPSSNPVAKKRRALSDSGKGKLRNRPASQPAKEEEEELHKLIPGSAFVLFLRT